MLAVLALLVAGIVGYASRNAFDSQRFAERATATLDDEAVRAEISRRITDDLILNAQADLVAFRPAIESAVAGLIGSSAFQGLFQAAVADVHSALFDANVNSVTLTLADIGIVVRGALQALAPRAADQVPADADADVTEISPPDWIADLSQLAEDIALLELILLAVALALGAAAAALSRDRRQTVFVLGLSTAAVSVVAVVALGLVREVLLARIDESDVRDAAAGVWAAFIGDLRLGLIVLAGCGAVLAAAASSLLRPVDIAAPVRRGWEWLVTVPRAPRMRVARALILLTAGVVIVVRPQAVIELIAIAAGLYIAYAGVAELLRLTIDVGADAKREAVARHRRRSIVATALAAGVIVLAGGLYAAGGGIEERPEPLPTVGCNGSEALCDRSLDEIALPSTHNAMSAVTNPDWLFGQQDDGFPAQLRDGIRGLLIDAHYGVPTESGEVKTDLTGLDSGERAAIEETLGSAAIDAALRIRDRIVNSPASGPRQVYLCHGFCEVGALPIDEVFVQVRDFLAANPNEVIVIVIEDYVSPGEVETAVEATGLLEYVYTGPLTEPLPTLGEMIESGGRVVMLAENDSGAGSIPWYHPAFETLVQETPYSFKERSALTDPAEIPASCAPNRGPDTAPLFQINHWIDTSPAPRPSNAAAVNAHDALLKRVRECERRRDLRANLIAVDFYQQGDLFAVVGELNRE